MRQLSGIDAAFLPTETPTTYAHVALVAVLSPAPGQVPLTLVGLRQLLTARIHCAPVLRRLLTVPFEPVVSSVPGPTFPLHLRGARVLAAYPVSVVTDGLGLNVTVLATEHSHDVGLTACRELVPDRWQLSAAFRPSLDELLAGAQRS